MNHTAMRRRPGRAILSTMLCAGLIYGCRRHETTTASPGAPRASATRPTTSPAERPTAALWIDGISYRFPPATLVLYSQGEGMSATLCSDDPPAAINAGYRGNSFMIQMKLDIESPDDLDDYVWRNAASTNSDVDSNTGIFLDGTGRQLQPTAFTVAFHRRGDDLLADIDGQFQSLDSRSPGAQRRPASVTGRLYIQLLKRP